MIPCVEFCLRNACILDLFLNKKVAYPDRSVVYFDRGSRGGWVMFFYFLFFFILKCAFVCLIFYQVTRDDDPG